MNHIEIAKLRKQLDLRPRYKDNEMEFSDELKAKYPDATQVLDPYHPMLDRGDDWRYVEQCQDTWLAEIQKKIEKIRAEEFINQIQSYSKP